MKGGKKIDISIKVAIIVGAVNLFALLFVAWQTYLTRSSVRLSERNLIESQQTREFENLPKANQIIIIQYNLRNWKNDLQLFVDNEKSIRRSIKKNNPEIEMKFQHYCGDEKIVSKGEYNHLSNWLQTILMAGAQYYYEGMCLTGLVFSCEREALSRLNLLKDATERANIGIMAITEMQSYINKLVPDWYLECPAATDDSKFLY